MSVSMAFTQGQELTKTQHVDPDIRGLHKRYRFTLRTEQLAAERGTQRREGATERRMPAGTTIAGPKESNESIAAHLLAGHAKVRHECDGLPGVQVNGNPIELYVRGAQKRQTDPRHDSLPLIQNILAEHPKKH
jgi:hypothetical protein